MCIRDRFGRRRPRIEKVAVDVRTIVGTLFLGFGSLSFVMTSRDFLEARRSADWPATHGVIESSKVVERHNRRGRAKPVPSIQYRFEVDGVARTGKRMFFGDDQLLAWSFGGVESFVAEHPAGAPVEVHYDPQAPDSAVVDPGVHWAVAVPPVFCLLFVFIGGAVLAMYSAERVRQRKAPRRALAA